MYVAGGVEMLQRRQLLDRRMEVTRRRFLSPFDAGVFGLIAVRCSLVFTFRLELFQLPSVGGVLV